MKQLFNRALFVLALFVAFATSVSANEPEEPIVPPYEISGAGSGTEGFLLVKVYVTGKKVQESDLKRVAVHGVLFRSISGNKSAAYQPAMLSPRVEKENMEYFKAFFAENGDYAYYASIVPGSFERIKVKKGKKLGAIVQVDKRSLRKNLRKEGLTRSLSSGF